MIQLITIKVDVKSNLVMTKTTYNQNSGSHYGHKLRAICKEKICFGKVCISILYLKLHIQFVSIFKKALQLILSFAAVSVKSVPDSTLSSDVIEQILLQKIIAKEDEIKKAFQIIDIDQTLKVTKGEFRRVIETFILPLTDEQLNVVLAKVCVCIIELNSVMHLLTMFH